MPKTRALITIVAATAALTLSGCGSDSEPVPESELAGEEDQVDAGNQDSGVLAWGDTYTFADGLELTLTDWSPYQDPGFTPSSGMAVTITVNNPTDQPIETTQAWVSLDGGPAGENVEEYLGPADAPEGIDFRLQPGASAEGAYYYDTDADLEFLRFNIQWLESDTREAIEAEGPQ